MAISDSAKVDLLYKKYFGVAKTDTPTNKSPSNESIASPSLLRGENVWQQSASIPTTAAAVAGVVQAYQTTGRVECVPDTTATPVGGVYPTWKTNLSNWIPSEFGATYFVKIYAETTGNANPTVGTPLSDSGIGGVGEWNFDYQAGVLNFIGGTIPTTLTAGKVIYVTGYRYIGTQGVSEFPNGISIGNLTISGNTISGNSNVTISNSITTTQLNATTVVASGNISAGDVNGTLHGNVTGQTGLFSSNVTSQGYMAFGLNAEILQAGVAAFVNDSYGFTTQYNTAVVINNMQGATNQTLFLGDTGIGNARTLLGVSISGTPIMNLTGAGDLTITGNLYAPVVGNVTGTVAGNIAGTTASFTTVGGTLTTAAQPNITSVGTLTSLSVTGNIATTSNVTASSVIADHYGDVYTNNINGINGNLTITVPTNQVAIISSDQAVKLPSGTSSARPTGVAGYIRYNSDTTNVEYYDGSSWVTVTNKVSSQTFSGDGVNATYTLSQASTVQNLLVSVNGTLQQPTTSYTVLGDQITFTEVLLTSDVVDIRYLGGVTSFSGIVTNDLEIQGNLTITGILQAPQATKASNAPGTTGQVCWDSNYIYVCTAPNTWKRTALAGGY